MQILRDDRRVNNFPSVSDNERKTKELRTSGQILFSVFADYLPRASCNDLWKAEGVMEDGKYWLRKPQHRNYFKVSLASVKLSDTCN